MVRKASSEKRKKGKTSMKVRELDNYQGLLHTFLLISLLLRIL